MSAHLITILWDDGLVRDPHCLAIPALCFPWSPSTSWIPRFKYPTHTLGWSCCHCAKTTETGIGLCKYLESTKLVIPAEHNYNPNNFAHDGRKKNTSVFSLQELSYPQEKQMHLQKNDRALPHYAMERYDLSNEMWLIKWGTSLTLVQFPAVLGL